MFDLRKCPNAEDKKKMETILREASEARMSSAAAQASPLLRHRAQDKDFRN